MTQVNTYWSSGALGDKHSGACVGVAGEGLPAAYYYTHGNLTVRQNEDGTIDINQSSLVVEQNGISNASGGGWGADTWWFHGLYVSRSSFTLYDGPGGPSGYGSGVKVWDDGKISHEGYGTGNARDHYSWLSSGSSTGWKRIANSIHDLQHNTDNTVIYLYAGGIIDYSSTPTSDISIPAARIALASTGEGPGIETLFEYYPWQRMINNTWYSLNREGGQSDNAGLFRMADVYNKCTNIQGGTASDQHGFTYNEGWQVSPKSGEGAL